ncbi:APC family permease [Algoriphagus halophilus]|uniref:Amino acid/polyamine/organocation transporter, APC superfamily n=1 Tax=Algoriphagus halophilus TaxID=226505 RepID=A0A1N6D8K9_9BACT|nr:APC family permease [Algoriphagus halophilus]SIN67130.1 amino acid/polyamine/organocation transporter, APC superfamily [Algoriphagus halophilus]
MSNTKLTRQMGLLALIATGVCSMLGASINVVPFMIQRNVPGIGPYVLPAFLFAAIPALFAAFAYGILSSAMPRAGGSYIYASRGLNPYLGFVASFSQWFGLSIVIGVISYLTIPFIRDISSNFGWNGIAETLEVGWVRVSLALGIIWGFVLINIQGIKSYEKIVLPMMFLMFALGGIVIFSGLIFDSSDFLRALQEKESRNFEPTPVVPFDLKVFLSAAALLFSSFIGFDSIAQAGGEAKNPTKNLPKAIVLAIVGVGAFYFLFSASVYHIVPWSFVAEEALKKDISAPGLLSYVLPSGWGVAILVGAAIALINDLPAMLLSVSRLMFAWAEDGIFPAAISKVHLRNHTPYVALLVAGCMASIGVIGSHFAGDFFLGIDIMVTSMMVNFLLMCITLVAIPRINPQLAKEISVVKNRKTQLLIGWSGILTLSAFLIIHTYKDLTSETTSWYFHSTPIWLIVMGLASIIFAYKWKQLKKYDPDLTNTFLELPTE